MSVYDTVARPDLETLVVHKTRSGNLLGELVFQLQVATDDGRPHFCHIDGNTVTVYNDAELVGWAEHRIGSAIEILEDNADALGGGLTPADRGTLSGLRTLYRKLKTAALAAGVVADEDGRPIRWTAA